MARIRTIKPEFPHSESVGRLSRDARLLYIQLWTVVDDAGRFRASSRLLASLLYPYDNDAPELIAGWLMELEKEGCILLYSAEGNSYLECTNFLKHQKIDHPSESRLPAPSRSLAKPREDSLSLAPDLVPSTVVSSTKPRAKSPESLPETQPSEEDFDDQMISKEIQIDRGITGNYLPRDITAAVKNMRLKEGLSHNQIREVFNKRWDAYVRSGGKCGIKSWIEQGGYLDASAPTPLPKITKWRTI